MDYNKFCNYVADSYLQHTYGHLSEDDFDYVEGDLNLLFDLVMVDMSEAIPEHETFCLKHQLMILQSFGDHIGQVNFRDFLSSFFTPSWDK